MFGRRLRAKPHQWFLVQRWNNYAAGPFKWKLLNTMKAIEQYYHVALFIMLCKVVLLFTSVDETLVCDHLSESFWAELSCVHVVLLIMLYKVVLTFSLWMKPSVWPFKWKPSRSIFMWYCLCIFSQCCILAKLGSLRKWKTNIAEYIMRNSLPELSYPGPCHLPGLHLRFQNNVDTRNALHLAGSPADNGLWWLEPKSKILEINKPFQKRISFKRLLWRLSIEHSCNLKLR